MRQEMTARKTLDFVSLDFRDFVAVLPVMYRLPGDFAGSGGGRDATKEFADFLYLHIPECTPRSTSCQAWCVLA